VIEPGEGYRLLVEGDVTESGDEYQARIGEWVKAYPVGLDYKEKEFAPMRRKIEQQKGDDMTNNKLPEVGEFWEAYSSGYRHKVLFREGDSCLTKTSTGIWAVNQSKIIASDWTHLPWCKSFDDAEPKPQTEEIEFREYIISGKELRWLVSAPSDAIPTGLVRKVKVVK